MKTPLLCITLVLNCRHFQAETGDLSKKCSGSSLNNGIRCTQSEVYSKTETAWFSQSFLVFQLSPIWLRRLHYQQYSVVRFPESGEKLLFVFSSSDKSTRCKTTYKQLVGWTAMYIQVALSWVTLFHLLQYLLHHLHTYIHTYGPVVRVLDSYPRGPEFNTTQRQL